MDLLLEEVPPAEARRLRAAIALCPYCRSDFALLSGIDEAAPKALMAEAPMSIDAVVMAAAFAAHDTSVNTVADRSPQSASGWARFVAFVGQAAVGPQFAMATVMLLVAAVGFWYVPARESRDVLGSTVVALDPEGEAVATADDPETRETRVTPLAPPEHETLEDGRGRCTTCAARSIAQPQPRAYRRPRESTASATNRPRT